MPRLYHRKSQFGCQRCKRRKVKCDEIKPKCGACIRHHVECVYAPPVSTLDCGGENGLHDSQVLCNDIIIRQESRLPPQDLPVPSSSTTESQFEMRLLHHFTAFAALSISSSKQIWQVHAPRLAFEYRFVFDAVTAVSALHLSRDEAHREATFPALTAYTLRQRSHEYLSNALAGYQSALNQLSSGSNGCKSDVKAFEAVFVSSSMVSLCTLCQLGYDDRDDFGESVVDEALWVRLVMGSRQIVGQWKQAFSREAWMKSEVYTPEPDLSSENMAELFDPKNRVLLQPLIDWTSKFIVFNHEEKQAFEHTLSYLGLIYNRIWTNVESAQASCHRLRALPARVPRQFGLNVVNQCPLALSTLAFVFALMKLLSDDVPWFKGVAERQIPLIEHRLPVGWRQLIRWPVQIANESIGKDTKIYVYWKDSTVE